MAEIMQEVLERRASDIAQKVLNTFEEKFEEKFEKKFDELFQDWAEKIGLLVGKIIDFVSEEGQTEIKKQEVLETFVFEKGLSLEETTEDNNFQNALEKIQMERQVSDVVQKFLNTFEEKFEIKFDEWLQDWVGKAGLLEEKITDSVFEEGQTEIKKQEIWEIFVFEKGLALEAMTEDNNFQNVLEKIQKEKGLEVSLFNLRSELISQTGKAGGLFLPEVRRRKEGEIVKKGMGKKSKIQNKCSLT